jgi:hypothetical protein
VFGALSSVSWSETWFWKILTVHVSPARKFAFGVM